MTELGTSTQMLTLLRNHYLPEYRLPAGIFAAEIQAPGASGRRADLIWQGVTTRDRLTVGHEIKVSRQDLRNELDDPDKCVPWKRYCDYWWLVIPHAAILSGLDIPEDWGVMLPPSGRRTRAMTVHREAARLTPEPNGPAMQTLAIWMFWRHHSLQSVCDGQVRDMKRLLEDKNHLAERFESFKAAHEQGALMNGSES